jgi:hypothetical protein
MSLNNERAALERKSSADTLTGMQHREYRRKDSAISTTSSLEALDFLADMCVEIDEINTAMNSPRNQHFFPPNSDESLLPSRSDHNILKRECSEISPRSRSSLTPASTVSRTLSKGFSFSSTNSNPFGFDHSDALAILNGRSDSVEDPVIIPLTLFHYGDNGIYLIPTNPNDIQTLLKGSQQTNHHSVFTFSLTHGTAQQHHTQLSSLTKIVGGNIIPERGSGDGGKGVESTKTSKSTTADSRSRSKSPSPPTSTFLATATHTTAMPTATATSTTKVSSEFLQTQSDQLPSRLLNPKHIYKTSCDTYRVQMSKGSKTNPNGKFSRNTRTEVDALWLCEFALLLVERPCGFDDILTNGNYKCLLQRKLVTDSADFASKLIQQMSDLSHRGLLKPAETEKLALMLPKFLPQQIESISGSDPSASVGGSHSRAFLSDVSAQESPLPYLLYSPDSLMPSTLPNQLPATQSQSFFPDTFNVDTYLSPEPPTPPQPPSDPRNPSILLDDADQKKRRRGGPTPVMVQRHLTTVSDDLSSSPVFLQAPPTSAPPAAMGGSRSYSTSSALPLTTQNLAQVNSSKVRQYPALSYLTSQYVKQKSRSFEETINTVPIDPPSNKTSPLPSSSKEATSPPLRKYV